jgi:hypothetical protein
MAALDAGFDQGRRRPQRSFRRPRPSGGPSRCHGFRSGAGCYGRMESSRDLDVQDLRKGRRRRRCAVKEGKEPSLPSFKGGREGAVSETSPLMRQFKNARYSTHYAQSPRHFSSPTTGVPRVHGLYIFTWSSDRALMHAVGGPSRFWGPLALRSLKRARSRARLPGATVGVLDTEISQSTCSWGPSMAQLQPRGGTTTEASGEDPHEEAPHEENNDQNC